MKSNKFYIHGKKKEEEERTHTARRRLNHDNLQEPQNKYASKKNKRLFTRLKNQQKYMGPFTLGVLLPKR